MIPLVNPFGWAFGDSFTSAQANQIQIYLTYAIDGHGGGTYAPSAPLILGGAGIALETKVALGTAVIPGSNGVAIGGPLAVGSDSTWTADDGAVLAGVWTFDAATQIKGTATFKSGSHLKFDTGADLQVKSGASFETASGALVTFAADQTISGATTFTGDVDLAASLLPSDGGKVVKRYETGSLSSVTYRSDQTDVIECPSDGTTATTNWTITATGAEDGHEIDVTCDPAGYGVRKYALKADGGGAIPGPGGSGTVVMGSGSGEWEWVTLRFRSGAWAVKWGHQNP